MDASVATILAAIIVSVPGVVAMVVSIKNHGRLTDAMAISINNQVALTELHLTLNSRLTELLRTIAATNQAIGRADQKRDEDECERRAHAERTSIGERAVISILISLLILCLVAGVIYYIITLIPLPEPFKRILTIIFLLIVLLVALSYLLPLAGVGHPLLWR